MQQAGIRDISGMAPGAPDTGRSAPSTDAQQARPVLNSLQVLRGFAAIAVAIYHTQLILASPNYGAITLFTGTATKGWLGVNFFFVLSGFIILYAHIRDIGVPQRAPTYLWRRFSRVYPIYWVALTGYIAAAYIGIGHPDFRSTIPDMLSAYLLFPFRAAPSLPLQVAWTLIYEVAFYGLFALAILNRKLSLAVLAIWPCALLIATATIGSGAPWLLNIWNIYFLFGAGAFLLYRKMDSRFGPATLGIGLAILLAMASTGLIPDRISHATERPWQIALLALPFALILLGVTLTERERRWQPPRLLLLLGDASYAIYLVHSAVISAVAQVVHRYLPGLIPPTLLFCATAGLSVVAGTVFHLLFEKPLLRAMLRRPAAAAPATAPVN